ncbi:MAG: cupin [Candidatus Pelagibacter sp.]|nr:cupin [Candidatus Pelagibacter sp.]|tara:strand:- start:759 stop:1157 length:399 start_codon:yes stop_codon:yes gene_type:complete
MSISKTLIKYHKMIPHPEGGHYVEVFRNKDVSHIYFLLEKHEFSHWHKISKNETLHFYSGNPLTIFTSKDGINFETVDLGSKNNFIYNVKKNTWFAMKTKGSYSLIGCTVAPAFEFDDLELAPVGWKPKNFW